ncbi:MAG: hypothetical protein AABY53_09625 [Bdellovibrionota bacterium]
MKTNHYVFFGILIAAVALVGFDLSRRNTVPVVASSTESSNSVTANATVRPASKADPKIFIDKFSVESAQIIKAQNNPELALNKMKRLAESITAQDVQELYNIISNEKNDGDTRALAIELLSIKNDTASLIALQNFVANNRTINGTKWDRKKELETVLRAQAVEGIASYPQKEIAISTLSYLQHKVDERFLNDRISRAAANLDNRVPTLQPQEEAGLKKLVE